MIQFFLKRPIAVSMATIALIVLGIIATLRLPVSLMPNVDIPEISIHYSRDNASVNEIENTITEPLRNQLQQTPHLSSIQSESKESYGNITMRFDYGTSIDYAFIETNQKVDAAMGYLPTDLQRPTIIKSSTSDIPVFYIYLKPHTDLSDAKFLEFCEFTESVLKKRLEQLPDVAMIDISGTLLPEMYILPNESKLRSLNITQEQLTYAINSNNQVAGNIQVRDGYYQYSVKFTSQLMSEEDVRNVYLNIGGQLIQIRDIAKVGIRSRDKRGVFLAGDKQSLCLAVIKSSNARMSDMKESVANMLTLFRNEYKDVDFSVSRDQAALLNYSINNLKQSLILGIFLAITIMLLFLKDSRSPFIIGISIPVSIVITILFFQFIGLSINTISLSGLIMGVGMMIDNSIIVIDNINQYRRRGYSLFDSCNLGTVEIIRPLISSVLTTCAVFIPLIFLGGVAGALFYDQAIAVMVGLFVSLAVSISIVPVLFLLLYRKAKDGKITHLIQKISLKNLDKYYTIIYHKVFNHRYKVMIGIILGTIIGIGSSVVMKIEQMPPIEINEMFVKVDWNTNLNIDENKKRIELIVDKFKNRCTDISVLVGEKQFILSNSDNQNVNEAEIYVMTKNNKELNTLLHDMENDIRTSYPEASINMHRVENLFEQLFRDDDPPLIINLSSNKDRDVPSLTQVTAFIDSMNVLYPDIHLNKPATQERIVIEILPDRMALYKVNQESLITALEKNISKTGIGRLNNGNRYIPIVITEQEHTIRDIINTTQVYNSEGELIPVNALIKFATDANYKSIIGRKEGTVVPLKIYNNNIDSKDVMNRARNIANKYDLDTLFGGNIITGKKTLWEMMLIIGIAILMLYFILAAQFESLWLPLIVLTEIPIDIAFTLLTLSVFGISLNLMSMIGLIVMCGIIINDSILKIDTIIHLEESGMNTLDAIHEGGLRRLKPILMTSLTTILAMVPMLWGNDIGSQLQRPLAVTIVASMTLGTLVSLYFVPLCYYFVKKRIR